MLRAPGFHHGGVLGCILLGAPKALRLLELGTEVGVCRTASCQERNSLRLLQPRRCGVDEGSGDSIPQDVMGLILLFAIVNTRQQSVHSCPPKPTPTDSVAVGRID